MTPIVFLSVLKWFMLVFVLGAFAMRDVYGAFAGDITMAVGFSAGFVLWVVEGVFMYGGET